MYIKKILASLVLVSVMAVSAAMFAAYEAHVINVTAHIENALNIDPDHIDFGTVFPQEYLEEQIEISLSDSFIAQAEGDNPRVNDVEYIIRQKPKPMPDSSGVIVETTLAADAAAGDTAIKVNSANGMAVGDDLSIGYHGAAMERGVIETIDTTADPDEVTLESGLASDHTTGEVVVVVYKDLCPFLSKIAKEQDEDHTDVPSYYDPTTNSCTTVTSPIDASGSLALYNDGTSVYPGYDVFDGWRIDLKVPPIDGYVGQDWPEGCPVVYGDPDSEDYGCDLWIEVVGFTKDGVPIGPN